MTTGRGRRAWRGPSAIIAALLACGAAILAAPPVTADIASISPSFREVDPGGSTSATVNVSAQGSTCVFARPSHTELQPSFSRTCHDVDAWSTTLTVQVPDAPGTYSVRVTDDQAGEPGGKTFTIRVRPPPPPPTDPPPPPPTTTTTARPTTTRPPTTTTAPPETTVPPETTTSLVEETTTTTEAPTPLPGDAFATVADLLEEPLPTEGLFLPLVGDGYRSCLPLTAACGDAGSALVLVPARTTEIVWEAMSPDAELPAPRSDLRGLPPIAAVGVAPESPRAQNYVLPLLDLTASGGGQLRTLVRSLDDRGGLVFALGDRPLYAPVPQGPSVAVEPAATTTGSPFGRPTVVRGSSFTEAAPTLAVFASPSPQLVYGVRADVAWGLNLELVPLFGDSVPFLVRGVDGPPGLFISRPAGLRVPTAGDEDDDEPVVDEPGGGPSAVVWLGIAVGAGAIATALIGLRRRRSGIDDPYPQFDDDL